MFLRFLFIYLQILQHSSGSFTPTINPAVKDGKHSYNRAHVYWQQPPPTYTPSYTPYPDTMTPPYLYFTTSSSLSFPYWTTSTMTINGPPTPPKMESGCQDSANCSLYNSAIICDLQGAYYLWARKNCPLLCGFCQKVCRDDPGSNCVLYNPTALCNTNGVFYEWASKMCPAYCGFCHEATTLVTTTKISSTEPPKVCRDSLDCRVYNASQICSKTGIYYPWSRMHCPLYCGYCQAPTRIVACRDRLTNCDEYSSDICVNPLYRLWREDNCRKFCRLCSGFNVEIDYSSVVG